MSLQRKGKVDPAEYSHLTQKERMIGGYPYILWDEELSRDREIAKNLVQKFNAADEKDAVGQRLILGKLFNSRSSQRKCSIEKTLRIVYGYNITHGDNFIVHSNCIILDNAPVTIGDNVTFAPGVHIYATTHPIAAKHRNYSNDDFYLLAYPVKIGNDVQIGSEAVICPGVVIGDNSVIGAGAVVVRDVPARSVVAGNPAKVIRQIDVDTDDISSVSDGRQHLQCTSEPKMSWQQKGAFDPSEYAHMSEKERMIAGYPYVQWDAELTRERAEARKYLHEFNTSDEDDAIGQRAALAKLFNRVCSQRGCIIEKFLRVEYGYNITHGENFFANFDCVILDCAPVEIGDNVLFAPGVHIYTAIHPLNSKHRKEDDDYYELAFPVKIGNNVWIGGKAIICPGVVIGENSVIGAGAVVVKDVPANVVVAGNPVKIIRHIDEEAI